MTIRHGLTFMLLALVFLAVAPAHRAEAADARPNIIWIIADDLGYGDVGAYGSALVPTPHIDRLAASGVRFTDGYVTAPICSPSRAGLHTGVYQTRFGYDVNPTRPRPDSGMLPADRLTVAERLNAAGYATGLVGKWHLGVGEGRDPQARGFDEAVWWYAPSRYIVDPQPGDEIILPPQLRDRTTRTIFDGAAPLADDGYLTDILNREALAFIERASDAGAPFFLAIAHYAPHVPLEATAAYLERVAHIEDREQRIQAAMILAMDDGIGALLDLLAQRGLADTTFVAFLSDNGCPRYIEGDCSNAPFSGFKREHLEGGIRVPMIARLPRPSPAGIDYTQPVISLDIAATSLALAGVAAPGLDGRDLRPHLTGAADAPPHAYLFWRAIDNFAVRSGRWKLWQVRNAEGGPPVVFLFDLETDPAETVNLADAHPDIVARLTGAYEAWNADNAPPAFAHRTLDQAVGEETVTVTY